MVVETYLVASCHKYRFQVFLLCLGKRDGSCVSEVSYKQFVCCKVLH